MRRQDAFGWFRWLCLGMGVSLWLSCPTVTLQLTPANPVLRVGEKVQLRVGVLTPKGEGELHFRSSDSTVATVDSFGVVEAKQVGKTVVTVTGPQQASGATVVSVVMAAGGASGETGGGESGASGGGSGGSSEGAGTLPGEEAPTCIHLMQSDFEVQITARNRAVLHCKALRSVVLEHFKGADPEESGEGEVSVWVSNEGMELARVEDQPLSNELLSLPLLDLIEGKSYQLKVEMSGSLLSGRPIVFSFAQTLPLTLPLKSAPQTLSVDGHALTIAYAVDFEGSANCTYLNGVLEGERLIMEGTESEKNGSVVISGVPEGVKAVAVKFRHSDFSPNFDYANGQDSNHVVYYRAGNRLQVTQKGNWQPLQPTADLWPIQANSWITAVTFLNGNDFYWMKDGDFKKVTFANAASDIDPPGKGGSVTFVFRDQNSGAIGRVEVEYIAFYQ